MVSKRPHHESRRTQQARYEEELRNDPPIVIWELVPDSGGLRVAVYVKDPQPALPARPPCSCNIYGAPRRRHGPHHDETCGRWKRS